MSVQQGKEALAPSSASKFPAFKNEQQKRPIMNGRPMENHGLPVHLFHPVFSRFQHTLADHNVVLTADDYAETHEYISVSAELYDREQLRQKAILKSLNAAIHFDLLGINLEGCGTIVTPTADNHNAIAGFYELKNEIGTGNSDPAIQGALLYRKAWVADEVRYAP
jgi:hypothetical protein